MKKVVYIWTIALVVASAGFGSGCVEDEGASEGAATTEAALDEAPEEYVATTKDNRDIAYRVIGSGQQDVVLVHGWMLSGAVYDNLIDELASADYRLIVPDLRGTGDSDKPKAGYSIENYLKDVEAVVDDAGADPFVLIGHSMGGAIAQKYAAKHASEVEGLGLLSPVPASGFPLPDEDYAFFESAAHDSDVQKLILQTSSPNMSQADLDHLASDASKLPPKAIEQSLEAWVEADFEDQLSNITAPTKVWVSDDPFMDEQLLQALVADPIDDASVAYFSGAGHYAQVEMPAELASRIDTFIGQLP
ncbi:MAG: alpha/beta fold hydrolase [Persicimonas sp.]